MPKRKKMYFGCPNTMLTLFNQSQVETLFCFLSLGTMGQIFIRSWANKANIFSLKPSCY